MDLVGDLGEISVRVELHLVVDHARAQGFVRSPLRGPELELLLEKGGHLLEVVPAIPHDKVSVSRRVIRRRWGRGTNK